MAAHHGNDPFEGNEEALFEYVRSQPAAVDGGVASAIEVCMARDAFGITRRSCLAVLKMPASEIFDTIERDHAAAVALADLAACACEYKGRLRALAELVEAAELRIKVALCWRDDMEAVIAEASA